MNYVCKHTHTKKKEKKMKRTHTNAHRGKKGRDGREEMTIPGKDGCAAAVSVAAGLIMFRDKTKRGFYDHTLSPGCVLLFFF